MKTTLKILAAICLLLAVYCFVFYKTPETRRFEKTLSAAQQGDRQSAFAVAELYARGLGIKPSGEQAVQWYRQAAADGNAQAAYELAQLYVVGTLVPQDFEEAATYLQLAAREGNAQAQNRLADFYEKGLGGLAQRPGEALFWRLKSAAQGNRQALAQAERAQTQNQALYTEITQFMALLDKAAQGDSQAQLQAGQGYRDGVPVLANPEEAARWFTKAWQEGEHIPQAAYELAQLYEKGDGVEKDEAKALQLLGAAAEAKNAQAQYQLGMIAYEQQKYTDAFAWFSNAAENGSAAGQYMTGFLLMQGQGTEKSVSLAIKFFRDAAAQNYTSAQYVLGQIYWKGLGVPKDKAAGKEWLDRAAANGNTAAQALLQGAV